MFSPSFSQELECSKHKCSAHESSSGQKTSDKSKEHLRVPVNQLQVPPQRIRSNSLRVCFMHVYHAHVFRYHLFSILKILHSSQVLIPFSFFKILFKKRRNLQRNNISLWIWSLMANVDVWRTSAASWIRAEVLHPHPNMQMGSRLKVDNFLYYFFDKWQYSYSTVSLTEYILTQFDTFLSFWRFFMSALLLDTETFFNLLANTQSHRLDDQRVSLPSLPGLQNESNTSNGDSSYLCYMVSKVQVSMILQTFTKNPCIKLFSF